MELRQLKTFITVAQLLSFNRAAETLNYAQSTISTQIRLLEEEFGKPLFDRLGKTIVLTDAGQMLLRYAYKMLAIEKEAVTQVAGGKDVMGTITLRVPQSISTYIFPPVIKTFHSSYGHINFHINHCAMSVLKDLRSGIIDLAFLLADSVQEKDLIVDVLSFEKIILVAGVTHPMAAAASIHLKDLNNQTVLIPTQDCAYKMTFERWLTEAHVSCAAIMELNSLEAMKKYVEEGVGIAIIPEFAAEKEIARKSIVKLPWDKGEGEMETALLMIRHKDKWISPHLEFFMSLVKDWLRK